MGPIHEDERWKPFPEMHQYLETTFPIVYVRMFRLISPLPFVDMRMPLARLLEDTLSCTPWKGLPQISNPSCSWLTWMLSQREFPFRLSEPM